MKILFGSQFYTPSIGGVQEVMRQLGEEMVLLGHEVTMVTSASAERNFTSLNGIEIKEFDISGNEATGMTGEVKKYQEYVLNAGFDLIMVMAAQQWTFDALIPLLKKLPDTRTVFIPCGFSALYDPVFSDYFKKMPNILKSIDHLVFHSTEYRDIDFAKSHGCTNLSVIPCGATKAQFLVDKDPEFKQRHNIKNDSFIFLTVGSFTGLKGHLELLRSFSKLELPDGKHATLIMNGNVLQVIEGGAKGIVNKLFSLLKTRGAGYILKQIINRFFKASESPQKLAAEINQTQENKSVLVTDFERDELTQAFLNSDLFVFASNVEYSPLVLFETAAAGTPFLSGTVGNSPEIAKWTGAGVISESSVDDKGYTHVDEEALATNMLSLMYQNERLCELGEAGRKNFLHTYNWTDIARQYEKVFLKLVNQ